ncbi:MAG: phosphoribosyltransferase family protein [Bilifractor sp.]
MSSLDQKKLEEIIQKNIPGKDSSFRDFRPIYADPAVMSEIVAFLAGPFSGKVDLVASPESLGFILGSMAARELGVGFAAIRSGDHFRTVTDDLLSASYIDHRDMPRSLMISRPVLPPGSRVLLADDYVETAATITACIALIEEADAELTGIISLGADYNSASKNMIDSGRLRTIYVNRK